MVMTMSDWGRDGVEAFVTNTVRSCAKDHAVRDLWPFPMKAVRLTLRTGPANPVPQVANGAVMYTNVTIPVDPHASDSTSIVFAAALARRLEVGLELVSVATEHDAPRVQAALEELAVPIHTPTECRVLIAEKVTEALLGDAHLHSQSFWCVPTHAKTAVAEAVLGSVSEEFVRDVGAPVILVGPHVNQRSFDDGVVLVAVDGTTASEQILPVAADLARTLGLGMRIVHVVDPTQVPDGLVVDESNYIRRLAKQWSGYGLEWDYEVLHGKHPSTAIIDYVERETKVVLVAASTTGAPVDARLAYPSSVFRIVRKATCPVVVLHAPPVTAGEHGTMVVAGIDTSSQSPEVLEFAAAEAERRGTALLLVHAWEDPVYVGGEFGIPYTQYSSGSIEDDHLARADEARDAVRGQHRALEVHSVVTRGRAAEVLVDYSRHAAVIIVGHHTHGRLSTLLLGSTARAVVTKAWCPTIVVPCGQHREYDGKPARREPAVAGRS
jgi:nucleotide-binding universal stress UspA family protein